MANATFPGMNEDNARCLRLECSKDRKVLELIGESGFRFEIEDTDTARQLLHGALDENYVDQDQHVILCADLCRYRRLGDGTWYYIEGECTPCEYGADRVSLQDGVNAIDRARATHPCDEPLRLSPTETAAYVCGTCATR